MALAEEPMPFFLLLVSIKYSLRFRSDNSNTVNEFYIC